MKLKASIHKFEYDMWSYYVSIPKEVGDHFIDGDDRRVVCIINGAPPIHSALMPKGEVYSIYMKKEMLKKLNLQEGDEVDVTLEKDTSAYGMPIPESF
ncbi:MAG: DUF1905 domain-containing protein, partial [Bacteroidota bacterium]